MEKETILEGHLREMFLTAVLDENAMERRLLSTKMIDILTDIEFWEGGSVEIVEGEKEVWVSADNGVREISEEIESFFTF
jgi:hypothetical protein